MSNDAASPIAEVPYESITKAQWWGIYWRALWRGAITNTLQLVAVVIVAFIIGLIGGILLGERVSAIMPLIKLLSIIAALPIMFVLWSVWFRWCLSIKVGDLRIAIIRDRINNSETAEQAVSPSPLTPANDSLESKGA